MSATHSVNYIKHLKTIAEKFSDNNNLSAYHISIYWALFHSWNQAQFRNPISIARSEIKRISKVGSNATYHKALHVLTEQGYIQYKPSKNPLVGSIVYMLPFDNSDLVVNKSRTSDDYTAKHVATPYKTKETITKTINTGETERPLTNIKDDDNLEVETKEKIAGKRKVIQPNKDKMIIPPLDEIVTYFLSNNSTEREAQSFRLHYQSNGWMVGRNQMKDWKASAEKWILRSHPNFAGSKQSSTRTNLTNDKDYDRKF